MASLIGESTLGRIANLVSGGKLFPPAEHRDPSLLEKFRTSKSPASASGTSVSPDATSPEGENVDLEKVEKVTDPENGKDYLLVDWTENDPEVLLHFPHLLCLIPWF